LEILTPDESVKYNPLGRLGYEKIKLVEAIGLIALKRTGVTGTPTVKDTSVGTTVNWSRSGRIWILMFAEITCPRAFDATKT